MTLFLSKPERCVDGIECVMRSELERKKGKGRYECDGRRRSVRILACRNCRTQSR